jgi:hypothetical protein
MQELQRRFDCGDCAGCIRSSAIANIAEIAVITTPAEQRCDGTVSAGMRVRDCSQAEGTTAALGVSLLAYTVVFGLFAIALYWLLQPHRVQNPGLAAYEPPPGTVISYQLPARLLAQNGQAPPLAAVESAADETTGRSAKVAELAPEAATKVAAAPERATQPRKPKRPRVVQRERRNPWGDYAESYWSYGGYRRF